MLSRIQVTWIQKVDRVAYNFELQAANPYIQYPNLEGKLNVNHSCSNSYKIHPLKFPIKRENGLYMIVYEPFQPSTNNDKKSQNLPNIPKTVHQLFLTLIKISNNLIRQAPL